MKNDKRIKQLEGHVAELQAQVESLLQQNQFLQFQVWGLQNTEVQWDTNEPVPPIPVPSDRTTDGCPVYDIEITCGSGNDRWQPGVSPFHNRINGGWGS